MSSPIASLYPAMIWKTAPAYAPSSVRPWPSTSQSPRPLATIAAAKIVSPFHAGRLIAITVTRPMRTTKIPTLNLPSAAEPARIPPIAARVVTRNLIRSPSASTHQMANNAWNASKGSK